MAQTFNSIAWSDLLSIVGVVDINEGSFVTAAPSADRSSVNVPTDGHYKIGLNLRIEDDSTVRRDLKIRIAVYRDAAALANPVVIGSGYYRGIAGALGTGVNMVAFGNLEAGDQIRIQGRIEFATEVSEAYNIAPEASDIWVTKELGAAAAGASGQESEANANNGNTFVRLYRKAQADAQPAEPGPAYTGGEYVALTAFGLWKVDPPALSGTQVLWVANGGTVLDSGGNVQNRDWQIYVSLVEQYAEHFQDSDTYSLTLTADSRFVRSFTTNGPGAWKRIEDGTNGWVDLVTNVKAHNSNRYTVVRHGITGGFDATFFTEIELELTACGRWPADNLGMNGIVRFRRQGTYWTSGATTENNSALNTPGHGSFKVSSRRRDWLQRAFGRR